MVIGEGTIDDIIESYELPEYLKEKLRFTTLDRFRKDGFACFEDLYSYITELTEKFRIIQGEKDSTGELRMVHWMEKSAQSLDKQIKRSFDDENVSFTLHDVLGLPDPSITALLEEPKETKRGSVTFQEISNILLEELDETQSFTFRQLFYALKNQFALVPISPEYIYDSLSQIKDRLEILTESLGKDGKLLFPPRPIFSIRFTPELKIKYRRRNFNGNPLAFYQKHLDVYGGMSKKELCRFDSGMYQALQRAGQIDQVIENTFNFRKELNEDEVKQVLEAHTTFGGNSHAAAKELNFLSSPDVVRRYWKNHGLKLSRNTPDSGNYRERKNEIILAYKEHGGNLEKASKQLDMGSTTVLRYWAAEGLHPTGRMQRLEEQANHSLKIINHLVGSWDGTSTFYEVRKQLVNEKKLPNKLKKKYEIIAGATQYAFLNQEMIEPKLMQAHSDIKVEPDDPTYIILLRQRIDREDFKRLYTPKDKCISNYYFNLVVMSAMVLYGYELVRKL